MKRMHLHVAVTNLAQSIRFYSSLFGAQPTVEKADYAKWMLDDPRVNFAISARGQHAGLDHVGIQVDSAEELHEIQSRLQQAEMEILTQTGTTCCYAKSDKHWAQDPSGIAWETYHTLDSAPTFNDQYHDSKTACCAPATQTVTLTFPKKKADAR